MITLLPHNKWDELGTVFYEQFEQSDIPTKHQAIIPAEVDDESGRVLSFVVLEQLWRIGQVWSEGGHPGKLFKFVEANIGEGSVVGIASEPRFETLFRKFQMHEMKGKLFRRDF